MKNKLREIKYVCSDCGHSEVKLFSSTAVPQNPDICPECHKLAFSISFPTYKERLAQSCK
jgi:DNA replicative helicase MCM subunit Mcm2 (Cdc46/Mcm family)